MIRITGDEMDEFLKTTPVDTPDFRAKLEKWKLTMDRPVEIPDSTLPPVSKEDLIGAIGQKEYDRIEKLVGKAEMVEILKNEA